jgi:predicted ferric reductase
VNVWRRLGDETAAHYRYSSIHSLSRLFRHHSRMYPSDSLGLSASSVHICGIVCAIPLLLIHGTIRGSPITLYFTILPVCLYLVDSLVLRRYLFSTRQAEIIHLTCTPLCGDTSNGDDNEDEHVVKLVIRNPDFRFTPGQYAEMNIPQLARYEWHPFTIANAPNLEGKVVFYIKAAGRWTSALHELVSEASVKGGDLPIAYVGVRGP